MEKMILLTISIAFVAHLAFGSLEMPEIIYPKENSVVPTGQVMLKWKAVPNAKQYVFAAYNVKTGKVVTSEVVGPGHGTRYPIRVEEPTEIYWEVAALDGEPFGIAGTENSGKFRVTWPAPLLIEPTNKDIIVPTRTNVTLKWWPVPSQDVTMYEVKVSDVYMKRTSIYIGSGPPPGPTTHLLVNRGDVSQYRYEIYASNGFNHKGIVTTGTVSWHRVDDESLRP